MRTVTRHGRPGEGGTETKTMMSTVTETRTSMITVVEEGGMVDVTIGVGETALDADAQGDGGTHSDSDTDSTHGEKIITYDGKQGSDQDEGDQSLEGNQEADLDAGEKVIGDDDLTNDTQGYGDEPDDKHDGEASEDNAQADDASEYQGPDIASSSGSDRDQSTDDRPGDKDEQDQSE